MPKQPHRDMEQLSWRIFPYFPAHDLFKNAAMMNPQQPSFENGLGSLNLSVIAKTSSAHEIEKVRYLCAFNMVNNDGTLASSLTFMPACICSMATCGCFLAPRLPLFVRRTLHNYHPDVCIPYGMDQPKNNISRTGWRAACQIVHTPPHINVIRSPGSEAGWLERSGVSSALAQTSYDNSLHPLTVYMASSILGGRNHERCKHITRRPGLLVAPCQLGQVVVGLV